MFAACRTTTSAASAPSTATSQRSYPATHTATGNSTVTTNGASDAFFRTRAMTSQTTAKPAAMSGNSTNSIRAGGDALAALAVERERVADDRRGTEDQRTGPAADREADTGRDRALGEVHGQHERP